MSAPYPPQDPNNPYQGYPAGQTPYPPPQWGAQPGYQPPGYQPNMTGYQPPPPPVGFQMPGFSNPNYPSPSNQPYGQQPDGYDPSKSITNPPYMDDTDPNYNASGMGFSDKSIRAGFIRRVYSILSVQLLVTLGFVMLFMTKEVQGFAHRNPQLIFIPMIGTIAIICAMSCFESARRSFPTNIILLAIFTFLESILVGFISSTYKADIVLLAVGLTAAIVLGLTAFAFQTKYDFTTCGGFLCIMLMMLTLGSIIGAFFFRGELSQFIMACFGAALFSMYIVYDTQLMMGGEKSYSISPEEYIFAALNLYLDIIQLFIYLLRILKYINND